MFCDRDTVRAVLQGKRVAIVGSGPGALENKPGVIDGHDIVVRVNNYKLFPGTGKRTDVFYSYFGNAIRKTPRELQRDGVKLCMCKCPDGQFIESEWHRVNAKQNGVDFRYIYTMRERWWFCPTYQPTLAEFLDHFNLLGGHVPTTGFAALRDVLSHDPASVFLTGFDFFASGLHNVNERWRPGREDDPIGHRPEVERDFVRGWMEMLPLTIDRAGGKSLSGKVRMKPARVERFARAVR